MRAYSICCAAREIEQQRHQKLLALHAALSLLPQDFFEQNALVRDMLVDDPKAVASGRDDEAVVNLAERPKIGERGQALRSFRNSAAAVGHACRARSRSASARSQTSAPARQFVFSVKIGKVFDALLRQRRSLGIGSKR